MSTMVYVKVVSVYVTMVGQVLNVKFRMLDAQTIVQGMESVYMKQEVAYVIQVGLHSIAVNATFSALTTVIFRMGNVITQPENVNVRIHILVHIVKHNGLLVTTTARAFLMGF